MREALNAAALERVEGRRLEAWNWRADKHKESRPCIYYVQEDAAMSKDHPSCMRCEALIKQKARVHKDKLGA